MLIITLNYPKTGGRNKQCLNINTYHNGKIKIKLVPKMMSVFSEIMPIKDPKCLFETPEMKSHIIENTQGS